MQIKSKIGFLACALTLLFGIQKVHAGGAYIIQENVEGLTAGFAWDNSAAIDVHPEAGVCDAYSHDDMVTKIETLLQQWSDQDEIDLTFNVDDSILTVDVDGDNYGDHLSGITGGNASSADNDVNAVVFDDTGDIFASLVGCQNIGSVLGFANPANYDNENGFVIEAQAAFNCACLNSPDEMLCDTDGDGTDDYNPCTTTLDEDSLDHVIFHELGHFLNLDHSQVNRSVLSTSDTDDDDDLPAMYPVSIRPEDQVTPSQDDIIAMATLYPGDGLDNYCLVTGTLVDRGPTPDDDDNTLGEVECVDVQATTSDTADSVAFVSGALGSGQDNNDDDDTVDYDETTGFECSSGCGDFFLYLEPGKEYTITANTIASGFTGGSGISPCANGQRSACSSLFETICYGDSNAANCADDDDSTACVACSPCIEDDEVIATISATDCVAGETLALGNLSTDSIGLATATAINDNLSSSGSTTTTSSSSSSGCSLSQDAKPTPHFTLLFIFLGLLVMTRRQFEKSQS